MMLFGCAVACCMFFVWGWYASRRAMWREAELRIGLADLQRKADNARAQIEELAFK